DNGDMYVDGHKAASDVRDEFVSVTEKLMDELAQCYNVLPQLDINNTIDHRPEGDCSRARRCVEACVYGTLDFVGYPRFPAPVEFIAAVIAYYVHPVNIQTACLIMEGAEFTENIIN